MKKAWLTLFVLTIAGSVGTACTITTTDDDTVGGSTGFGGAGSGGRGGTGTGGTSNSGGSTAKGGASSGGTAGTGSGGVSGGGSGGTGGSTEPPVVCDVTADPTGTPATTCQFQAPDNTPCHECLAKIPDACAAIKECYGTNPRNQCAWGGPDGGSEFICIESCIRQKVLTAGSYTDADEDACVTNCTTPTCALIGNATSELLGYMHANCEAECFEPTK